MKLLKFIGPAIGALAFFVWACEGEDACLSNQNAVQVRMYSAWSEEDKDSTLSNVSLVGLDQVDSIYQNESVSELFMPLDYERDTTTFILSAETLRDTLSIVHSGELDFISGDCGYIFSFELDTILHTRAFIDSASVSYPFVEYGESFENIKLYIY
ncbi:MAG: DUF6452 family protein [Marinilabiliaceae bacterium]